MQVIGSYFRRTKGNAEILKWRENPSLITLAPRELKPWRNTCYDSCLQQRGSWMDSTNDKYQPLKNMAASLSDFEDVLSVWICD